MKHLLITIAVVLFVVFVQADSKPYKGKVHQIPGKIEAEHYDEGAPGKAYYDVDKKKTLGPTTAKSPKWILRGALMPPMAMA